MTLAVCAIVVTYQPDISILRQLLKELNDSACDFWVIDNHSDNAASLRDAMLRTLGSSRFAVYQHVVRRPAPAALGALMWPATQIGPVTSRVGLHLNFQ
jgi:hypothetical protein